MSEIDLDAVRDAIGTVRLWAPVSATKDIHWFARDLADRAEALLARIAELEAERNAATIVAASAKIEAAAAERRGYERAVARLRDLAAMFYPQAPPDSPGPILRDAADHLDAMKENTDG